MASLGLAKSVVSLTVRDQGLSSSRMLGSAPRVVRGLLSEGDFIFDDPSFRELPYWKQSSDRGRGHYLLH